MLFLSFSTIGAHASLDLFRALFFGEHERVEYIGSLAGCKKFLPEGFESQFVMELLHFGRYPLLPSLFVLAKTRLERVSHHHVVHDVCKFVFVLVEVAVENMPKLV